MGKKMVKLVALVLMMAFASLALFGCGGNDANKQQQGNAAQGGNQAQGDAAGDGALTFAQGAEPRGLDPALVDDGESSKVIVNIYEGLVEFADDSTEIEPCLATDWTISEDGLTYTFNLREGVTFHDGEPFNADAVKFNVDRQTINKTADMGYADFVFGAVAECNVIDDYTIEFKLKAPSTPFMNNLAMSLGAPIVSPKALQENENDVNRAPVGTGPYKFVEWNPDQDIILERYDGYWGEKAATKNILFKFIKENSSRVMALVNGETDMLDGIDASVVGEIENAGMKIFKAAGMNVNYMAYNMQSPIMQDKEVRVALSQAINVPELVEGLYQGYATLATSILPDFMPGYSADVTQIAYDPEAAKATLAAKGVTELHAITYTNPRPYNTIGGQALAEGVLGYFEAAGVKLVIDSYDWTTYKEKVKNRDFDICFYGWNGDNGDADNFMSLLKGSVGDTPPDPTMNVAMYDNAEFNALLDKAAQTPNGDERNALYAEMEQFIADEAVWLPISHSDSLSAYNPAVNNYSYHVTGNIFFKAMSKAAK